MRQQRASGRTTAGVPACSQANFEDFSLACAPSPSLNWLLQKGWLASPASSHPIHPGTAAHGSMTTVDHQAGMGPGLIGASASSRWNQKTGDFLIDLLHTYRSIITGTGLVAVTRGERRQGRLRGSDDRHRLISEESSFDPLLISR